jgi:hypothetical protein
MRPDDAVTRMAALEAVAEKARKHQRSIMDGGLPWVTHKRLHELCNALHALDAVPAPDPPPAGEVVEFAWWEHEDGMVAWYRAGSEADLRPAPGWTRCGTVKLPVERDAAVAATQDFLAAQSTITTLRARVEALEGAVQIAAAVFGRYAELHQAKGTREATAKAHANEELATQMRAALEPRA